MRLRSLKPGDTVAFVTPASPIPGDKLAFMSKLLGGEGYKVKVFPHALDHDGGFFAGSDQTRAEELMAAFEDPEVGAVMCTRGGYGCARLFPYLDFDRILATRKMLIGFSDITVLHMSLNNRGMPSVHGPMAYTLNTPREDWVYESFTRVLRGDLTFPEPAPISRTITITEGVSEGEVVGGCLILLSDAVGTPEMVNTKGKILAIEGVDSAAHRNDAMLTQMLNAGVFEGVAGVLVGEMTRSDELADEGIGVRPWREYVLERLGNLGVPTVMDFPFGHTRNMLTLPFGVRARLDATAGTLTYLEPLCE